MRERGFLSVMDFLEEGAGELALLVELGDGFGHILKDHDTSLSTTRGGDTRHTPQTQKVTSRRYDQLYCKPSVARASLSTCYDSHGSFPPLLPTSALSSRPDLTFRKDCPRVTRILI